MSFVQVITKPEFADTKPQEEWTDEELKAYKDYENKLKKQEEEEEKKRKQLEVRSAAWPSAVPCVVCCGTAQCYAVRCGGRGVAWWARRGGGVAWCVCVCVC